MHSPSTPAIRIRPPRASAQAATPNAIPSRNGIRPIATFDSTPAVNSQAASAPAVRDGAAAWASGGNSAVATSAAPTPTSAGPKTIASGANSSE